MLDDKVQVIDEGVKDIVVRNGMDGIGFWLPSMSV